MGMRDEIARSGRRFEPLPASGTTLASDRIYSMTLRDSFDAVRSTAGKKRTSVLVFASASDAAHKLVWPLPDAQLLVEDTASETSIAISKWSQSAHRLIEKPAAPSRKRVMIVDDSKTIRQLLRSILSQDPALEIVAETGNPEEAEALVQRYRPDVMTLDIDMPKIDGVTLLGQLFPRHRIPTVMITAMSMEQGSLVLKALEIGAVDYLQKPTLENIDQAAEVIKEKVKAAAQANLSFKPSFHSPRPSIPAGKLRSDVLVAIGSSTGGTEALRVLLTSLPKDIPPIVVVQHIPAAFSTALANRLNDLCPFEVREAKDGDLVVPGRVLIAPGGTQFQVQGRMPNLIARVGDGPLVSGHKPSVDHLFESVVRSVGKAAIGVILTGMGKDGAKNLLQLRQAGAHTIGQNEESCVVYGMPGAARALGAVVDELSLERIGPRLIELMQAGAKKSLAS